MPPPIPVSDRPVVNRDSFHIFDLPAQPFSPSVRALQNKKPSKADILFQAD
jgi:hypothetical protein